MQSPHPVKQPVLVCALLSLLLGCGGGGGGGGASSQPQPQTPSPLTPQSIAFTSAGPVERQFGDPPFTNTASGGAGSGAVSYASGNAAVATVDAARGQVSIVGAGSVSITATKAADSAFASAQASYTLNVAAAAQTIAFASGGPIGKSFGDSPFANAASGGGGSGAVSYASSNSSVALVNPSTGVVTIVGAGTANVGATKAADANYREAFASYTVNVAKATQAIGFTTAGPISKTFGDPPFANSVTGGVGSGAISYSSSNPAVASVSSAGLVTIVGAGVVDITAVKSADNNYFEASAHFTVNAAKAAQVIAFNNAGPISKRVGDPQFTNAASGGSGTGAITYASSNSQAATVSLTSGLVTVGAVGVTTITATKSASANHLAAQASYTINVAPLIDSKPISAWIGTSDMQVSFAPDAVGADFVRAIPDDCTTSAPTSCSNSSSSTLISASVTDTLASLSTPAEYWLHRGTLTGQPAVISTGRYMPPISRQDPVVLNDQLWMMGNSYGGTIWSSNDGRAWRNRLLGAPFGDRNGGQVFFYNGRIWSIGGALGTFGAGGTNDVWSSNDGVNWNLETGAAAFAPRANHRVVVLNGKMWLVGGQDTNNNTVFTDVWSSNDGVTWTLETAATPFPPRSHFDLVSFNGRIWLMGGFQIASPSVLRDVWSSADGVNWRAETQLPGAARQLSQSVVFGNRLYLIGGSDDTGTILSDVWYTDDGITWTLAATTTAAGPRIMHGLVVFHDRIFLIGGWNDIRGQQDVWSSTDGASWRYEDVSGPYEAMFQQTLIEFNGRLWAMGPGSNEKMNAWSTADGDIWTESPGAAAIPWRNGTTAAVFNNRLWILGGVQPGKNFPTYISDLWSTADGLTWTQSPAPPFVARYNAQMFTLNGRMFVLGGIGLNLSGGEVWSTADGQMWRQDLGGAAWGTRSEHQVVVFNGKAWLLGGTDQTPDIWSSTDGINWTQEPLNNTSVATRYDLRMVVLNNRMWVFGGIRRVDPSTYVPLNDVWSSSDGSNWTQEAASVTWSPRADAAVAAFAGKFWLFGGEWQFSNGSNREIWRSTDGIHWRLRYRNLIETP